jgi:hypothetical protein
MIFNSEQEQKAQRSIRSNVDGDSKETSQSDEHDSKQDSQMKRTHDGMQIDVNDEDLANACGSNRI